MIVIMKGVYVQVLLYGDEFNVVCEISKGEYEFYDVYKVIGCLIEDFKVVL